VLSVSLQKGNVCDALQISLRPAVSTLGALPTPAQAQDKKVSVSLGGGVTTPNAEVKDHLGNGFNINVGVEVKVTPVIGIEGLYSFNGLGDKRISIPVSGTPGERPSPPTSSRA
jgi:hypothetical protein